MADNITRREAIGGGILAVIPFAQYIFDRWRHKDMVPLETLIKTNDTYYDLVEKQRIEYVSEMKEQRDRHLADLRECLEHNWPKQGCD